MSPSIEQFMHSVDYPGSVMRRHRLSRRRASFPQRCAILLTKKVVFLLHNRPIGRETGG